MNSVISVVDAILSDSKVKTAIKFVSPTLVVKATRYGKAEKHDWDLRMQIGKPNYRERLFIKAALKAGEKFPVRKVQVTRYLKKR